MAGRRKYTSKYASQVSGNGVSRQATHFTKRYGEMEYSVHRHEPKVLARGKYRGYPFVILNLGTHPTAYVCLPKDHPYFGKKYDDMEDLDVHGSVTFVGKEVFRSTIKDRWWIGWDYAHPSQGDYIPLLETIGPFQQAKKWTREEILDEIKDVISQLTTINQK